MRYFVSLCFLSISLSLNAQHYYMFVGTYTTGKSEGIYVYDFDAATGKMQPMSTAKTTNPSYLCVSPNGKFVYAVNETGDGKAGSVSAFAFDKPSGHLLLLNSRSSGGADPCYISENSAATLVVVANYTGGSLSVLPVQADGTLDSATQILQHTGSSINTQRQEKAHVHTAIFAPGEKFLMTADLGADLVSTYAVSSNTTRPLYTMPDSSLHVTAGSGPRHIAFANGKPYLYVLEELTGTVEFCKWNNKTGKITTRQRISAHPADYVGSKGSADIHISPDGKFLYASNRGDANSIAIFSINQNNGRLKLKGFHSVLGQTPRNFIIEPNGNFLLVANQQSSNIVVFRINKQTGFLQDSGLQIEVPNPVCIKLLEK